MLILLKSKGKNNMNKNIDDVQTVLEDSSTSNELSKENSVSISIVPPKGKKTVLIDDKHLVVFKNA